MGDIQQAAHAERKVVAAMWDGIEVLLTSPAAETQLRRLWQVLPSLDDLQLQELPELAKLHLSSASNMMATIRLLTKGACADSSADLEALLELDTCVGSMVTTLIDLQLFHLQRAAALTTRSRARLAQQRAGGGGSPAAGINSCSASAASSNTTGAMQV